MKKSLLAMAALTAFAGAASAQSSVTVFGILDVNIRNQDNGGTAGDITSVSPSGASTSRIGFRGVEDLGGGLRAGFWLEGQVDADTGNPGGQNWQRRSTVSLIGSFGEIRLGRDFVPTYWNHSVFDPFNTAGVGNQQNMMTPQGVNSILNSGAGTLVRASNMVGYFLPSLGGIYGQLNVAAAEGPANGNKYVGGRIGYAAGPVNVAFAYGTTETPSTDDLDTWNIGASYDFGFLKVMGQYHESEFLNLKQKNADLGVTVPLGPGTFKAMYSHVAAAGTGADKFAVGYMYDLSKRTAVYAHAATISNDAGGRFVTTGSGADGMPGGEDSSGYELGIRHNF